MHEGACLRLRTSGYGLDQQQRLVGEPSSLPSAAGQASTVGRSDGGETTAREGASPGYGSTRRRSPQEGTGQCWQTGQ